MSTPILGIDASKWQGLKGLPDAHWRALKDKGVAFAICRASIGTMWDPSFPYNRERAEKHGIVFGAYHFLEQGIDTQAQAASFVRHIDKTGGAPGVIAVLDVEWSAGEDPLTWNRVRGFGREMRSGLPKDHPRVIYSAEVYIRAMGNPDLRPLFDQLWQARWCCTNPPVNGVEDLPARPPRAGFGGFSGRPPLWQFGAFHYRVNGRRDSIDGNAWYGTLEELEALSNPPATPVPIEERPRYRQAYNLVVTGSASAAAAVPDPVDPGHGPAWAAGIEAAREDVESALSGLVIADPEK